MNTSRPAVDRLLDPANRSVTLSTLERAAAAVLRLRQLDGEFLADRRKERIDKPPRSLNTCPQAVCQVLLISFRGCHSPTPRLPGLVGYSLGFGPGPGTPC